MCESLTAGLAAATIAEVPGASKVLRGGLVTYATELKCKLAGVPQEIVDVSGVVSAECAEAMARGARGACTSDWAVSLTGVAGPDRQEGHPVGEVFIGVAGPGGSHAARADSAASQFALSTHEPVPVRVFVGSRNHIRRQAVRAALELLMRQLEGKLQ